MKTITILLTKYSDWISWIVYHIGAGDYTHASLALEGEEYFYSFNYHGFCIETIDKHKSRGVVNSLAYELQISEESYNKIKKRIEDIEFNRKEYKYTRLGLVFAILKIPFKWKKHYFCSQFIAELLQECGNIPLQKNMNTYLPNHFYHELNDSCYLKKIYYDLI